RSQAAPPRSSLARAPDRRRIRGDYRNRVQRRLEREGQARARLGAALSELAAGRPRRLQDTGGLADRRAIARARKRRRPIREYIVGRSSVMIGKQRIAVAGATGRVGRHVADVLEAEGHEVVAISRSHGVDLISGDGLADALAGVTTIVDAATGPSPDQKSATEFFTIATRNLQELGERAGVQRIVVVSIIGTGSFRAGYGGAKLVHERAMLSGPISATILRAAQFHEFVPELVDWGRQNGVSYVPELRTQLVAACTVAKALADL